jgi:4-hydroxyacetophenone monooxygenase
MRNQWAGEPFNSSDQEISEALLAMSIPTLMLSLVHITGDAELLRGPLRPVGLFLNEVQGIMSEEDKQAVRDLALPIIRAYRDKGVP